MLTHGKTSIAGGIESTLKPSEVEFHYAAISPTESDLSHPLGRIQLKKAVLTELPQIVQTVQKST